MIDFKTSKYLMRKQRAKMWKNYQLSPDELETKWLGDVLYISSRGYWHTFDRYERIRPNHYAYPIR